MRAARQDGLPGGAAGASLALHLGAALWLVLGTPAPGGPPAREWPVEVAFVPPPPAGVEAAAPEPSPEAAEDIPPAPVSDNLALDTPMLEPAPPPAGPAIPSQPPAPMPESPAMTESLPEGEALAEPILAPAPPTAAPVVTRPRPAQAQRREPTQHAARRTTLAQGAEAPLAATPIAAAPGPPPVVTHARYRLPPTPPAYPPRAVAFRMSGTALIRALVGPDGLTRELRLHRSSGHAELDQAALAAVRGWAFAAATHGGQPIEAWVEVPVRFRLDD
jgi:periplasmic protein TonB